MHRLILTLASLTLLASGVSAARAYPGARVVRQPDGSTLTIVGCGDEFRHCVTTTDGYSVVKGTDGFYRYAVEENGRVRASEMVSHNESERTPLETSFLKTTTKRIAAPVSPTGLRLQKLNTRADSRFARSAFLPEGKRSARKVTASEQYRGLVILVNFNDCKFSRGEAAHSLVEGMMNGENRTSYDDPLLKGRISCTGSVRDYFRDNSSGVFVPEFDVVGPVDVPESQYYINGTDNTYELCRKVLECADSQVDYSRYDCDCDGEVDMIYILYAGHSSSYQGNDERLVWPHAGHFADNDEDLVLDGKHIGRFACSSELFGWTDDPQSYLDGIGVIVHEFSHVLGFKDHYDVSGYLNEDPGTWDVMASGNYNGVLNDTPCGYSSYERHAAGFITPRTLTVKNDGEALDLRALSTTGEAYRIVSMQDSTVLMLENRQPDKWDLMLPGHGMLVWRVDSCDAHYWEHNALNVENRLHLKLVRANGSNFNIFHEMDDTDCDPFPGSRNVTELSNYTHESNTLSDLNYPSPLGIHDIAESEDVISFTVAADPYAEKRPYTFMPFETYRAHGILIDEDEKEIEWTISTRRTSVGNTERQQLCNLVPDTRNISSTDPKYADGLCANYLTGTDKMSLTIEPARVAVVDNFGVWLVDFTDLDRGGSGAIRLEMDPYGNLALADPESIVGYCTMPKTSVVADPISIVERFSMIKNLTFAADSSSIETVTVRETGKTYNLQGLPVDDPEPGIIYVTNGRLTIFR